MTVTDAQVRIMMRERNKGRTQEQTAGHTVLLAGTGTLKRGERINGTNHVIILNTE